jgi:DNA-directed RNA polymerase subunit RPC12/RpoP
VAILIARCIMAGPSNGVVCQRCHKPIKLEHAERVAQEFSVACPHCGFRTMYQIKDIKPLQE